MSKTLIFSQWNTCSANSKLAQNIVRDLLPLQQIVVIGTEKKFWIEEPIPTQEGRLHFHEIGEPIKVEEQEFNALQGIEYVVFQLLFYCRSYGIDHIITVGNVRETFQIVARVSLVTDFTTRLTSYIRGNQEELQSLTEEELTAYRTTFDRVQNIQCTYDFTTIKTNHVIFTDSPIIFSQPLRSIERARNDLENSMGIRIPSHSKVFFVASQNNDYIDHVIDAFEFAANEFPLKFIEDRTLLFVLQNSPGAYQKISKSPQYINVLYCCKPLPDQVLLDVYDSTNFGLHRGGIFTKEHVQRGRVQCASDEPIVDFIMNHL
jgi:hypothetical protein